MPARPPATSTTQPTAAAAPGAADRLDQVPTADLPLATSIGTVGLFAEDGRTVNLRAGGGDRYHPETHHGPVRVNRITVDITARYRLDDHGTWQRQTVGYGDEAAHRAETSADPTRAILRTVEDALAAALTGWAEANPLVLAAAQDAAYAREIAEQEAEIYKLAEQRRVLERRVAALERARIAHTQRWAPHLDRAPATVGSVAYGGPGAHYIVWAGGRDVAWGTVDDVGGMPHDRLLEAVRADLHHRTVNAPVTVADWHLTSVHHTTGILDPPEVAHAATLVAETIGHRLGRAMQPVTAKAVAETWSTTSRMRPVIPADQQPLADALELLADPGTIRAAGHAQLLRALIDQATTTAATRNPDALGYLAGHVPLNPTVNETVWLIRKHLRKRSGRLWSVYHDGTAAGRVTIHAPPSRLGEDGSMGGTDRQELARLLDRADVQPKTGVSVAASTGHRREYIARAMGLNPPEYGTQHWDRPATRHDPQ